MDRDRNITWNKMCHHCQRKQSGRYECVPKWEMEATLHVKHWLDRAAVARRDAEKVEILLDELTGRVAKLEKRRRKIQRAYSAQRKKVQKYYDRQKARAQGKRYGAGAKRKMSKKNYCENPECRWDGGFEYAAMLDVDHIDGNSGNDVPSNWQTLCANCHREKTIREKDHMTAVTQVQPGHGGVRPGAGRPRAPWHPDQDTLKLVKKQ